MTVEATKSSLKPFDVRLQEIRPHPGQAECAANLRRLLAESEVMASHADCGKVQDAYSLRCMPQVHGTLRDALRHVAAVVEREMNAAAFLDPAREASSARLMDVEATRSVVVEVVDVL